MARVAHETLSPVDQYDLIDGVKDGDKSLDGASCGYLCLSNPRVTATDQSGIEELSILSKQKLEVIMRSAS